jgi:hypothetical protein
MVSRQQNQIHQIFQQDRSENITVTWRRFARSSGLALGALDVGTVVLKGGFVNPPRRRAETFAYLWALHFIGLPGAARDERVPDKAKVSSPCSCCPPMIRLQIVVQLCPFWRAASLSPLCVPDGVRHTRMNETNTI